jgi:peptidoglycan/xylan/chitin deacetylase (PgdA/CDA1 family)
MVTLDSLNAFLSGEYQPQRDLCLLTFDDGLKEHFQEVTPILAERKIQGQFFLPTVCIEDHRVVLVHKNHFLMAALGLNEYRTKFMKLLHELSPSTSTQVDSVQAAKTYRFDDQPTAEFKYLLNFRLEPELRGSVLDVLFDEALGDESDFAKELYVSWDQARSMQEEGMVIGGHSHHHVALATLNPAKQLEDLETCTQLLHLRLHPQSEWPFCYPYGNPVDSFNEDTVTTLKRLGYSCGYTTSPGPNSPEADRFRLQRIDTTEIKVPVSHSYTVLGKG